MKRYRVWDNISGTELAYRISSDDENFQIMEQDGAYFVRYDADEVEEFLGTDDYDICVERIEEEG